MPRKKKPMGRPVEYPMPERIDASPEAIAETVLRFTPPAKSEDWAYMKDYNARVEAKRQRGG